MTTTTNKNAWPSIEAGLLALGYYEGAPSAAAAESDRETCAESTCESCGCFGGLEYRAWCHPSFPSYKAFAVCPCGHVEEF